MTDITILTIFIASIITNTISFALIIPAFDRKYTPIKATVFGTTAYFFIQIMVSAAELWFDAYSIKKNAYLTFGVCGLLLIASVIFSIVKFKFANIKKIGFSKKELIFFLAIIAVSVILSGKKFGFYGMGQDEGVYQTRAIEFLFGNNENVLDIDYINKVFDEQERYTVFNEKLGNLQGYYLINQTDPSWIGEGMGGETGFKGVYHGLSTWAAILALFGKMFGMGGMQHCQTFFLIAFLMIVFYILENFRIKTICEASAIAILATTPQIVWVSKSALTEMFLAVIVAAFVYLACHENKNVRLFSWIPVTIFSFFHVSAYTIMPIFVITGWMNQVSDKRKRSALNTVLMLLGYFAGFAFSFRLSTLYTAINYINPLRRMFLSEDADFPYEILNMLVLGTVALCLVISIILMALLCIKKIRKAAYAVSSKKGIILKIVSVLVMLFAIFMYAKTNGSLSYNPNFNLVALSVASGLIGILLAFIGIIIVGSDKIKGAPYITILAVFLYIVVWAVVLRADIFFFYYYGRYNVPFIAVVVIFASVIYRDIKKADWIPAICAASIFVYLDYDIVMNETLDDTLVEWDVMEEELMKDKLPNSAIILDSKRETLLEWMLPLKASGIDVYPLSGNVKEEAKRLSECYGNVYYYIEYTDDMDLTYQRENLDKPLYTYDYIHSEDYVNGTDSWTGYPLELYSEDRHLDVYLLN